jgi:hypothetical protein
MKLPDLSAYDDAGVLDWGGDADAVKTAAGAAKLTYRAVDAAQGPQAA